MSIRTYLLCVRYNGPYSLVPQALKKPNGGGVLHETGSQGIGNRCQMEVSEAAFPFSYQALPQDDMKGFTWVVLVLSLTPKPGARHLPLLRTGRLHTRWTGFEHCWQGPEHWCGGALKRFALLLRFPQLLYHWYRRRTLLPYGGPHFGTPPKRVSFCWKPPSRLLPAMRIRMRIAKASHTWADPLTLLLPSITIKTWR